MGHFDFVYKTEKEVKKLSYFDFCRYCFGINKEIEKYRNSDDYGKKPCVAIDQYMFLKNMENEYITYAISAMVKNKIKGFVINFVEVECEEDFEIATKQIRYVMANGSNGQYVIEDSSNRKIPFSYIKTLGVVFNELSRKLGMYLSLQEDIIPLEEI